MAIPDTIARNHQERILWLPWAHSNFRNTGNTLFRYCQFWIPFVVHISNGSGDSKLSIYSTVLYIAPCFGDSLLLFFIIRFMVIRQVVDWQTLSQHSTRVTYICDINFCSCNQCNTSSAPNFLWYFSEDFFTGISTTKFGISFISLLLLNLFWYCSYLVFPFNCLQLLV